MRDCTVSARRYSRWGERARAHAARRGPLTPTFVAAERAWLAETAAQIGVRLDDAAREGLLAWISERVAACVQTVPGSDIAAFPVVRRLIDSSTESWRRRTQQLFVHLVRDADELAVAPELAAVVPHGAHLHARPTTLGLVFGNGRRWMYRTRDRSQAAWFLDVCVMLNASGLSTPLHVRRIVLRDGCSWDEYVGAAPCRDRGEVERYFRRAGMLARLIERFAGVDFHARNMIAAGEHPVLVDVETLFMPWPARMSAAAEAFVCSPLGSGFLGLTLLGAPGQRALDAGGLHPGGRIVLPFGEPEEVASTLPAPLGDHVDDILHGYDEMDGCLARTDLSSLLARAPELWRRDLRTNGRDYREALVGSLAAELLRSEHARDRWLAARGFSADELAALRELELPRPMARVGTHPATAPSRPLSAAERMRRHDLIRSQIALRDDRPARPTAPGVLAASRVAIAVELADRLLALRFAGSEWHGVRWVPASGARMLDVLGPELYDGHGGLAVVFALLARATGLARFADAARGAAGRVYPREPHVGVAGLGGAIYALARCGQLLSDDALVTRAQALLAAGDVHGPPWDVLTGVAGFVLGACALGPPPSATVDALAAAWQRGPEPPVVLAGGIPPGVPDLDTGIVCALVRAGITATPPPSGALAWRVMLDPDTAGEEAAPLDAVDLALARHRIRGDATAVRAAADALVERYRATGSWFPETSIAPRHQTSVVAGIPAVIHALLAAEDPSTVSIRRLE